MNELKSKMSGMDPTEMALLLKTISPEKKNNLLFLITGMELQAAVDRESKKEKQTEMAVN